MKRLIPIILFAAAGLTLGSCKYSSTTDDKPVVTVSIEPQRWLLEQIVGDRITVRTLMARGGNPESYEPAFSHLTETERSLCYMKVGNLGFEAAIIDKVKANRPDLPVVNTSESINLIVDDHGHDHGIDPHVWSSAANARKMAANMLEAVKRLAPEGSGDYDRNYLRLVARIDSVDRLCAQILQPHRDAVFLVWHPSLSYFARDYGLRQLSIGAEGKEHSVTDTRDILDSLDADSTTVFLVQKDFDTAKAGSIANSKAGLRVVSINPLNYDWDTELIQTARAIAGN